MGHFIKNIESFISWQQESNPGSLCHLSFALTTQQDN